VKLRRILGLAGTLGLFVAGCGGTSTDISFDLENHHYSYTHAYYNLLGDPSASTPAAYTLELSNLDCATETRPVGDDLDVQLFQTTAEPPFTVKIESPDPAGNNTFWEGMGTVTVDQQLPNPTTNAEVAALNVTLTGTIDYHITGGNDMIEFTGSYRAEHCGRIELAE
jgi:hypothetical protein